VKSKHEQTNLKVIRLARVDPRARVALRQSESGADSHQLETVREVA
jgi:hypothetical protein